MPAAPNPGYGNVGEFHHDRFEVASLANARAPARILLVEDLWVTGSRAQSMAHCLKKAGAASVVLLALGRQINHTHPPSQPLLRAAGESPFDIQRCALDDLHMQT